MKKLIAFLASVLSITAASEAATMPSRHVSAETMAWEQAVAEGTSRAFAKFLLDHPESRFAEQARTRLLTIAAPALPATRAPVISAPALSVEVFEHI